MAAAALMVLAGCVEGVSAQGIYDISVKNAEGETVLQWCEVVSQFCNGLCNGAKTCRNTAANFCNGAKTCCSTAAGLCNGARQNYSNPEAVSMA